MSELASVTIEHQAAATIARLDGEVDLSNADDVRRAVLTAIRDHGSGLVLDLSATTYLDSTGLRLLFDLAEWLHQRDQRLALVVTDEALVRRVLLLSKLDGLVPLCPDLAAALDALGADAR
jgi:anti-anti-sigma factor